MPNLIELICKKRDRGHLSAEEIAFFFNSYLNGQMPDYQMSSMLMAININSMDRQETAALTKVMRDSGTVLNWSFPKASIVDKHSTGGVGDKTSLVILPLCTLEDLKVPMMSGRGLGHTGGTLDKLESIPGTTVRLSIDKAKAMVDKFGGVFIGQTEELAPLDKRIYALRDVTGTVESIPLITASILSKKTAEGIGNLVMDVKYGSGAFMNKIDDARALAESLSSVGKECGLNIRCLLTDMNSPLGRFAGHNLEIKECIDLLKGKGPEDTRLLSLELAAEMVQMAKPKEGKEQIKASLERHLANGKAFERFCQIISAQGGDTSYLENPHKFSRASLEKPVMAPTKGKIVKSIDVRALGLAIVALGGGRRVMTDKIDADVGLSQLKHVGESIEAGEPVAIIHANDASKLAEAEKIVLSAYQLGDGATSYELIKQRFV